MEINSFMECSGQILFGMQRELGIGETFLIYLLTFQFEKFAFEWGRTAKGKFKHLIELALG